MDQCCIAPVLVSILVVSGIIVEQRLHDFEFGMHIWVEQILSFYTNGLDKLAGSI